MPDTKEQATPTPRTDARAAKGILWNIDLCRQLETELAEANQRLAAMEEDTKRLDWCEAKDAMPEYDDNGFWKVRSVVNGSPETLLVLPSTPLAFSNGRAGSERD